MSAFTKPLKVTRVYILDGDEGQRHSCPIPGSLEEFGWCEIDRDVSWCGSFDHATSDRITVDIGYMVHVWPMKN